MISEKTPLSQKFAWKRDYYAGGLMMLLGIGAAVTGSGYKFGSLARMGRDTRGGEYSRGI